MEIIVRDADPAEFEVIGEIAVAAYRTIDPDLGGYEVRLRDVAGRSRHATVLVAVAHGSVIGTATYVGDPASPLAESDDPGDAGLRMLAVSPDAMGHGVGTSLVREAIARARRDGRQRLVLLSRSTMLAAHAIYERFGFERAPELDETWDDVTLLGFALQLS
jgi:ribosomal protein S18 acetylase RimI-like enzyme